MLRLSKLTDYAVVVLVRLLDGEPAVQTSPGIAAATGIPEPTVAKVLKIAGGRWAGGLPAGRARRLPAACGRSTTIPVADVIAAIDGPIALTACVDGSATECECHRACARCAGAGTR